MAKKKESKGIDAVLEENKSRKKSLKYSIMDGSFFGVMDSFTSQFIVPFALLLNASNITISLMVSLPGMLASIFQLAAIKINDLVRNRRMIIVVGAALQALLWLPIIFIPYVSSGIMSSVLLLLFVSLITIIGTFIGTFWRGFMGDLVPEDERGDFFSKRNLIVGIVSFISLYFAGMILQIVSINNAYLAFSLLFIIAAIARGISAFFLFKMEDLKKENDVERHPVSLVGFLATLSTDSYGRFVMFLSFFRIAIYIASPFFSVFMLKQLQFSYLQFTALVSLEVFATLIFLRFWGHLNDERGSKNVLLITGLMIPFIPFLWTLNHNIWYIALLQFFSGSVYAGFHLATENFIFDATIPEERIRKVSYFNLLHGTAIFIGSISGALLLKIMPIMWLFMLSSVARLFVALFFLPTLKEMRLVEVNLGKNLVRTHLYIRPRGGIQYETFSSYRPRPDSEPVYPIRKSINPFRRKKEDSKPRVKLSLSYDERMKKPINKFLKNMDMFNKLRGRKKE